MKTCKNCKNWNKGHEGMWQSENFGNCELLNNGQDSNGNYNIIVGLCEGCVNVVDKVDNFEFVTGENFGCVHWEKQNGA